MHLRSDSAGYQEDLIRYCAEGSDPRFGVIPFAIAARVSAGIKKEALSLDEKHWHPIYQEDADGNRKCNIYGFLRREVVAETYPGLRSLFNTDFHRPFKPNNLPLTRFEHL